MSASASDAGWLPTCVAGFGPTGFFVNPVARLLVRAIAAARLRHPGQGADAVGQVLVYSGFGESGRSIGFCRNPIPVLVRPLGGGRADGVLLRRHQFANSAFGPDADFRRVELELPVPWPAGRDPAAPLRWDDLLLLVDRYRLGDGAAGLLVADEMSGGRVGLAGANHDAGAPRSASFALRAIVIVESQASAIRPHRRVDPDLSRSRSAPLERRDPLT
jgi:hypothetical protein